MSIPINYQHFVFIYFILFVCDLASIFLFFVFRFYVSYLFHSFYFFFKSLRLVISNHPNHQFDPKLKKTKTKSCVSSAKPLISSLIFLPQFVSWAVVNEEGMYIVHVQYYNELGGNIIGIGAPQSAILYWLTQLTHSSQTFAGNRSTPTATP